MREKKQRPARPPAKSLPAPVRIACDDAQLAVECRSLANELGLRVEPCLVADPWAEPQGFGAVASTRTPQPEELLGLLGEQRVPLPALALLGANTQVSAELAADLGLPTVDDLRVLMAVLALRAAGAQAPWQAATRQLAPADRGRLRLGPHQADRSSGELLSVDGQRIALANRMGEPQVLGRANDVRQAIRALRLATHQPRPAMPTVQGVRPQVVLDVIFGPERALSDPASKAALEPYDVPFPLEELCASPSRAAAEATRMGYPVRVALASPDLRAWDYPELVLDGVAGAAQVREVYRQLMRLAQSRVPHARILGVTVAASQPACALLDVRMKPLPQQLVLAEVRFADAHGAASEDSIATALPCAREDMEQALSRLRGATLLHGPDGRGDLAALQDALLRLAAFTHEWRQQVHSVRINPLAVLVDGGVEAREGCVHVSDAFSQELAPASRLAQG